MEEDWGEIQPVLSKDFSRPLMQRPQAVQAWSSAVPALPLPAAGLGGKSRAGGLSLWTSATSIAQHHDSKPWATGSLDCCLVHAWTFTAHSLSQKAWQRPKAGKLLLAIEAFLNRWGCELCKYLPYKSVVWLGSKTKSHLKISSKFGHSIVVLVQRNRVNFIVISAWIKENYENKH